MEITKTEENVIKSLSEFLENHHPYENSHIKKTASRFIKYIKEFTTGYHEDIHYILEDALYKNKDDSLQVIKQNNINFSTICIHHLLPFYGTIDVEFQPDEWIVGLSKIPRICTILSKRMNIQEKLGKDIAKHIFSTIEPKYVKVTVRAKHCCMGCRGIQNNAETISTHYLEQD